MMTDLFVALMHFIVRSTMSYYSLGGIKQSKRRVHMLTKIFNSITIEKTVHQRQNKCLLQENIFYLNFVS